MTLRLSINYILFRIDILYYHSMMPLFRQESCAPRAPIRCHADFTSYERQHRLAQHDIIVVSNTVKGYVQLTMTKWRWSNIKKNFWQCLWLTFVVCCCISQMQWKLSPCELIWFSIRHSELKCYAWNSYYSFFIISHCNYLHRMRAHISNLHLWIFGQTKAIDCMCDQTNITRFQYKLMIGNSIFPKFVKDCFG
jgi:hypothetical protein